MAGKGGYQPPAHPAPVSGPGALSARTDGGPGQPVRNLSDAQYGENAAYVTQQQGAPVAGTSPRGGGGPGGATNPAAQTAQAGFADPSARPDEPVTAGAALGPGPGMDAITMTPQGAQASYGSFTELLGSLAASDSTGTIAALLEKSMLMGLNT